MGGDTGLSDQQLKEVSKCWRRKAQKMMKEHRSGFTTEFRKSKKSRGWWYRIRNIFHLRERAL